MTRRRCVAAMGRAALGVLLLDCVLVSALARGAIAQAVSAAGTWDVTYASGVRDNSDGSLTVTREAVGTFALTQRGDSVSGTWTSTLAGPGKVEWRVRGTLRSNRLHLVGFDPRVEDPPPAGQERVSAQEWIGDLEGDRLSGQILMELERPNGERLGLAPRPWTGARRRTPSVP